MRNVKSWIRGAGLLTAATLLLAAGTACDDDDGEASAEEIQEVEDVVRQALESDGRNAEWFLAHVTDNLIKQALFASREDCEANAAECIGEPAGVESISGTAIDGDTASTTALTAFGAFDMGLVREDGEWKVNTFQASSDDVPDGAKLIDLELRDFAFVFNPTELPDGGDFAFRASNIGAQGHEVVVVQIPDGSSAEEAVEAVAAEEAPPFALKAFIQPGQAVNIAFEAPLEPGRYALVCLFPDVEDPEFTAHIDKGMHTEFTVE